MNQPPTVNDIRNARDVALHALASAVTKIGNEIALTTKTGPYLDRLTKRFQDLMNERAAISAAATDLILSLPNVIAAAATLNRLSARMETTAAELPAATKVLTKTAAVLSLGQQFSDVIANAHKG